MPTYIVTAVCFGTITERWRVTSPTPLDHATIKGVIEHEDDPAAGASFACVESTAGDEQQREVTAITLADNDEIMDAPKTYGEVGWSVEDVQTLREDLTDEQAEDFLRRNEKHISERACELGWDVLSVLLDMDEQLPAKADEAS